MGPEGWHNRFWKSALHILAVSSLLTALLPLALGPLFLVFLGVANKGAGAGTHGTANNGA